MKKEKIDIKAKGSKGIFNVWSAEEPTVKVPSNFANLSQDEQVRYIHKQEQEARKKVKLAPTITHTRFLSEQQTKPLQLDLFADLAGTNLLKNAKTLYEDGKLLNAFSLGIDGDALTIKVINTLQEIACETSELYGKDGSSLSGSNTYITKDNTNSLSKDWIGIPKGTKYPAIIRTPYQFAKDVLGGRRPDNKTVSRIIDELHHLENGKFILQDTHIRRAAITSLLDVSELAEDNNTLLYIVLKPVFALVAGQSYISERKDVARYLRRTVRKSMTLLLYELLIEQLSRNYPKGEWKRYKERVFERIAKLKRYTKNPKERDRDFAEAIETMKRIKLLNSYSESETGSVCVFHLNENFLKEEIKL